MKIKQLFNDLVSTLIGRNRPVSAEAPNDLITYDDQAEKVTRFTRPSKYRGTKQFQGASDDVMNSILEMSLKHKMDPKFTGSVARQESSFRPNVISPDHGVGLFQLTPTDRNPYGGGNPLYNQYTDEELMDPRMNADLGIQQLAGLLEKARTRVSPDLAERDAYLMYNAGPNYANQRPESLKKYRRRADLWEQIFKD